MDKKKKTFPVSIILIIIVLTVGISLGLTLIKGYLTQNPACCDPIAELPDANIMYPISTASDTFAIEKDKVYFFSAKFYNNHYDAIVTFSLGECVASDSNTGALGNDYFSLVSGNQSVPIGSTKSFKMNLKTKPNISSGEYLCNFLAIDSTNDPSGESPLEVKPMVLKVS